MTRQRLRLSLTGLLQGIGFRPYIYRLASTHKLAGWVANDRDNVLLEIEGNEAQLADFLVALQSSIPACGYITELQQHALPPTYQTDFQLKPSLCADAQTAVFACPDIAVCEDCIAELFDPTNRRYQHPFISCCHCGPRYSVMYGLPYDREQTSLRDFLLCVACTHEYKNSNDRRFHAQTIACPECGPQLQFCDPTGKIISQRQAALDTAVAALATGKIIAVKAIGGFQIMLAAENTQAVARLRKLKHRASKPFAVMVKNLAQAETLANLTAQERALLSSAAAPIVLVNAKPSIVLNNAAPQQTLLGLMLPSAPLQHLLIAQLKQPLIATSGNRYGEPICIANEQALQNLASLVDGFLIHDRAILRPLDDSIVRVIADTPTVLRRARGYVPTPITLKQPIATTTLAVGGQLKNTVAIAHNQYIMLSQHLGDLEQQATALQHRTTINDLSQFYALHPKQVICDLHPDYVSSQYAQGLNLPLHTVQHHYAHILACMAEYQLSPPVLGVAWDGIGLGSDNQLWGGEFLQITEQGWQRIAHCRPFPLIGGFAAIKEPRRAALGLLYAYLGDELFNSDYAYLLNAFTAAELKLLHGMVKQQLNCPMTSSIGRLFDAFASLLGLCHSSEFEGQAAIALESCTMNQVGNVYPTRLLEKDGLILLDWQPMLAAVLTDLTQENRATIATNIHHSLAQWVFAIAETTQATRLVLSGGCFQNAYLVEAIVNAEQAQHYTLYRHANVPPNDGALALGQIYAHVLATNKL
jgi:hydrogenase maturation protein HypF